MVRLLSSVHAARLDLEPPVEHCDVDMGRHEAMDAIA
jgi:hypothetical protein